MSGLGFISRLFRRRPTARQDARGAGRRRDRRKDRDSPAAGMPTDAEADSGEGGTPAEPWYRNSGPLFTESFSDKQPASEQGEDSGVEEPFLPPLPRESTAIKLPPNAPMIQRIEDVDEPTARTETRPTPDPEPLPSAETGPFAVTTPEEDAQPEDDNSAPAAEVDPDAKSVPTTAPAVDAAQHEPPMVVPVRGYYLTRSDDTLRSVAAQFLNAPERWSELRAINAAHPTIASAEPDELLRSGTAVALPGDPLPWGRPDPVYLWTLAETFLYTAWGREPTPEEVVPFWRGLTRGALPEGEQPPLGNELPGIAEIEARDAATSSPEQAGRAAPPLPPPFEMPAVSVDEPGRDEPSPAEAPSEEPLPARSEELDEPVEPIEPLAGTEHTPTGSAVEDEGHGQLVAETEFDEAPRAGTAVGDERGEVGFAESEQDKIAETEPVGYVSSASSAGPDTADDADDLPETAADDRMVAETAQYLADAPEDAAAPEVEADLDLPEPDAEDLAVGLTFELHPARSVAEVEADDLDERLAPEYEADPAIADESAKSAVVDSEPSADSADLAAGLSDDAMPRDGSGIEPFDEFAAPVERPIGAASEDVLLGHEGLEAELVLEAETVHSRAEDDDIVDATIVDDALEDDVIEGIEAFEDTLENDGIAPAEYIQDDELVDGHRLPSLPEPEQAVDSSVPPPPAAPSDAPAYGAEASSLEPPPTFEDWLGEPGATSPRADPSAPYAGLPVAGAAQAPPMPPEAEAPRVPHFLPSVTGSDAGQHPAVSRSSSLGRSLAGTAIGDAMMLWQLARRRRYSQRGAGAPNSVEQALQQTASSESLDLIEAAMRHLYAVTVGQQRDKPSVLAVRIGTYGFEVLLDKPIETPPGWRSASGGFVLELPQGVTARDLSAIGEGPSLCPSLVPVGNTFEGPLLLNLEQLGCLAISGPAGPAGSLLGAIVSALGSSPMASALRMTAVGLDNAAGTFGWEAVRFTSYDAPDLEALLASAYAPGDGAVEMLVVGPGNDLLIQRAGQVATAPGSRLSLVGATSAVSARWPWRIHVDDTGTAVVHPISVTMTAARALPPEALAQLGGMTPSSADPAGLR